MTHDFFKLPIGAFDIIMADYPWPFRTYSLKGRGKSPQYPTMFVERIEATHPQDLLRPNGVAIFWCTWPLIAVQSRIIENAFGLVVKTGGAWSKRSINGKLRWGTGYIQRTVCEPYLIAARPGHRLIGRDMKNLIETFDALEAPGLARQNSRKPSEFYDEIERLTPGWSRADLFSREDRPGWSCFGNETGKFNGKK